MTIASDLTALCNDTSTLVNDILATNVLADVPASSMAVLGSLPSGSDISVQLSAGGNATLTIPPSDGLSFRLKINGIVHTSSTTNVTTILFVNGTQTSVSCSNSSGSSAGNRIFSLEAEGFWNSTTNQLILFGGHVLTTNSSNSPTSSTPEWTFQQTFSSPSSFQFTIQAGTDISDPAATVTITEFRALAN